MKNFILTIALFYLVNISLISQNVGINETGALPASSAILDIQSTDKGLLIPRTDTLSITSPVEGLLIYQNTDEYFYYFNGIKWLRMITESETSPFKSGNNVIYQESITHDFILGRNSLPQNDQNINDNFLMFDNSKSAFRGGRLSVSKNWSPDSTGNYSFAYGFNPKAKGISSTSLGINTEALGDYSFASGANTKAYSAYEFVIGRYNTPYQPQSTTSWNENDRLFVLGNGQFPSGSDAFTVLKNGNTTISGTLTLTDGSNGYTLPNVDGSEDQVLSTDGAGNLNWINQPTSIFSTDEIEDNDGTTRITTEENINEDLLRFYIDDAELMVLDHKTLALNSPGNSLFIGVEAGKNDDGSSNQGSFLGYKAGRDNTSGFGNSYLGYLAGAGNQLGSHNTLMGWVAGTNLNNGGSNTFIGSRAGYLNGAGSENTALGRDAGYANQIGLQNTFLGMEAGYNVKGSGNIMVGYKAGRAFTGSNQLFIDNSPTTSPLIWGDFQNDVLQVNGLLKIGDSYTFPVSDGTYGQVLRTDGFGQLSWTNSPSINKIEDADFNTRIQVEESTNEDKIRFDIAGTEVAVLDNNRLDLKKMHIGEGAGGNNSIISNNIFIGEEAGLTDNQTNNVAIGHGALKNSGAMINNTDNVAIGNGALFAGNAEQCVAVGTSAKGNSRSTSVGYQSGGGWETVAVGHNALGAITSISLGSVAIGKDVLYINEGSFNSGLGHKTLAINTTGYFNTAIGGNAMSSNIGGHDNTAIGLNSMANNQQKFTNYNTAIGGYSLFSNETGHANVALGYMADVGNSNISNATAIGSYAEVDCSNCLVLDTDADVGIRTSNPLSDLHLKHQNGLSGENGFRIENEATGSYFRFYHDGAQKLLVYSDYTPTTMIASVDYISGHWSGVSDSRVKKSREPLKGVLSNVLELKPEKYHFLNQDEDDKKYIGMMAQDVKKYFPELISYQQEADTYTMDYSGFGVLAIKAIQELNEMVEYQEELIIKQSQILDELLKRLNDLEKGNK